MPNLINRRKKKNKVPEVVVNDKSDSDSSCSYDFSSKLNCKYNVLPEDLKGKSKKAKDEKGKEDSQSLLRCDLRGSWWVTETIAVRCPREILINRQSLWTWFAREMQLI